MTATGDTATSKLELIMGRDGLAARIARTSRQLFASA